MEYQDATIAAGVLISQAIMILERIEQPEARSERSIVYLQKVLNIILESFEGNC